MRVYLDHQSSCPVPSEVRDAMLPYLTDRFGHPAALHREGLTAREAVKTAREQIVRFINAESPENILFTGGSTEAINLAIKGAAFALQRHGQHIVLSTAEQPGANASVEWLANFGFTHTKTPVNGEGRIDFEALNAAVRDDTILVCVHHANLDVGTIQPIERIHARNFLLFVDATASAGWIPLDVQKIKADLVALAPHRFYGPKGIGILYRHRRARLLPVVHGLDLDSAENVAAIVGAGKAGLSVRDPNQLRALQELFLAELEREVPYVRLNGPLPGPERLPNNLNISIEFVEGEGLALMLDVKGVALASGAACVTKTMRVPPVLAAIGLPESLARGNVIVSFGYENTEAEIRFAVAAIAKAVTALREMSPLWEDFKNGVIPSEIEKENVERRSS